jgi:hypothetical protein
VPESDLCFSPFFPSQRHAQASRVWLGSRDRLDPFLLTSFPLAQPKAHPSFFPLILILLCLGAAELADEEKGAADAKADVQAVTPGAATPIGAADVVEADDKAAADAAKAEKRERKPRQDEEEEEDNTQVRLITLSQQRDREG